MSSSVSRGLVVVPAGGAGEHGSALGLDLAGPLGDGFGVGPGVEGGLIAGEPGVEARDEGVGVLAGQRQHSGRWVLSGLHLTDGLLEPARREYGQQPPVDGGQHVGLAQVDVAGVDAEKRNRPERARRGECLCSAHPLDLVGDTRQPP